MDAEPMDEMQEIIQDFLVEAQEILSGLDEKFVALEQNPSDKDLLNDIFRSVHTIKGAAGFLGFNPVVDLTHHTENVLNKLRQGAMDVTPAVMDVVLRAVDSLKTLVEKIKARDSSETDLTEILGQLQAVLEQPQASGEAREEAPPSQEASGPRLGEILVSEGKITPEQLRDALEAQETPPKLGEVLVQQKAIDPKELQQALQKQPAPGPGVEQTIRVDIKRLDNVLDLVGELVLGRNRLAKLSARLEATHPDDELVQTLVEVSAQIDLITTDLQLAVMKTRLQPVRRVFGKFPRMVRDLARAKGKEVDLQIFGEETELDKSVIEEIGDPLVHLIRNAVDHGIEPPEERERAGKPRRGTIRLAASHEGNHILIQIQDDGRGMDPAFLRKKAVEKGLIDEAEAQRLSDQDAIQLIFTPGFSTASQVSDLSGRGVGMDVVKSNITRLNGTIEIDTAVGKGTTMTIKLPLTVAIIQALMVQVGQEIFAIPLSTVVETIRIAPSEIQTIEGREVVSLRKSVLPLVRLRDEFSIPTNDEALQRLYVVIVALAEKRFGILVDRLHGQEEVVIKSLGDYFSSGDGIAGATITGDGKVVLILDMAMLIRRLIAARHRTAVVR